MAVTKELSGIVLLRDLAGDRFLRIRIFDHLCGLKSVLFPLPDKKGKNSSPPDLLDDINCSLKPTKTLSSIPFVAEFQRVQTYRELASDPEIFLTASQIARFFLNNGEHLLEPAPRLKLLRLSLNSFARAKIPQVVLVKLYYCFARDEGLPVRESWFAGLPKNMAEDTYVILHQPVDQATIELNKVHQIIESLKNWMNSETELSVS